MTDNEQIATTILQQLGQGRLKMMTGADHFQAIEQGLAFTLPSNFAKDGINRVEIRLNAMDAYDLTFKRAAGGKVVQVSAFEDVFVENLRETFRDATGLAVTVPRVFVKKTQDQGLAP